MWYYHDALTNILSLNNVTKKFRVTDDSAQGDHFTVHKADQLIHFDKNDNDLFYHDAINRQITLLNTVAENEQGFSKRQLQQARYARKVYGSIGYPSMHDFKQMV